MKAANLTTKFKNCNIEDTCAHVSICTTDRERESVRWRESSCLSIKCATQKKDTFLISRINAQYTEIKLQKFTKPTNLQTIAISLKKQAYLLIIGEMVSRNKQDNMEPLMYINYSIQTLPHIHFPGKSILHLPSKSSISFSFLTQVNLLCLGNLLTEATRVCQLFPKGSEIPALNERKENNLKSH